MGRYQGGIFNNNTQLNNRMIMVFVAAIVNLFNEKANNIKKGSESAAPASIPAKEEEKQPEEKPAEPKPEGESAEPKPEGESAEPKPEQQPVEDKPAE